MAETSRTTLLQPVHPLASRLDALTTLPQGFAVHPEPYVAATTVRARGAGVDALASELGVTPPQTPNTWVPGPGVDVVWMGPDEWLVLGHGGQDTVPEEQEARLRAALAPHGGAAVDVSAQRIRLDLSGPHLRTVLAKGCALDLHRRVFAPGTCVQTTLGRAGVVLLAGTDPEQFSVLVRTSFAAYLVDWLVDASLELAAPALR